MAWVPLPEAARRLGIHRQSLWERVVSGAVPAHHVQQRGARRPHYWIALAWVDAEIAKRSPPQPLTAVWSTAPLALSVRPA